MNEEPTKEQIQAAMDRENDERVRIHNLSDPDRISELVAGFQMRSFYDTDSDEICLSERTFQTIIRTLHNQNLMIEELNRRVSDLEPKPEVVEDDDGTKDWDE